MATYDYRQGKKRVEEILDNKLEIIEQEKIPKEDKFTFTNGYYGLVSGIFVDIRNSSHLFADEDKEKIAKIIRSFTSEIIEILRGDDNLREIGIRGDCVYAIYTCENDNEIYEVADKTFWINTYMKMFNQMLTSRGLPNIQVGIGMSTAEELVVKAGRKDVGINNMVWIGKAVTRSANFSSMGNKNGIGPLVYSQSSYNRFIDKLERIDRIRNPRSWFTTHSDPQNGVYLSADIVKIEYNDWLNKGMQD